MSAKLRGTDKELQGMAERLNLSLLRDNLPMFLETVIQTRMTPRETLAYLFGKEIRQREENRIRLTTMGAHFPRCCTLESFDFTAQPSIDPGVIRELAELEWVDTGENAIFVGPPGTGKTHLAIALGIKAIAAGKAVRFFSAGNLLQLLQKARHEGQLDQKITQLQKFKLLIIDELGYLPFSPEDASLLFMLVNRRYETRSIIITSNRPPSEWGLVLGDPTAATAILDRLLHHCTPVVIQGESYRLKEANKDLVTP